MRPDAASVGQETVAGTCAREGDDEYGWEVRGCEGRSEGDAGDHRGVQEGRGEEEVVSTLSSSCVFGGFVAQTQTQILRRTRKFR